MKPDRILLAELRAEEAFDYLRNVNSGHPGSITSVHAASAELAFEQLVLLVKQNQGGRELARSDIKSLLYLLIDVVIQFGVERHERFIKEIWYRRRSANENDRCALLHGWSGVAVAYAAVQAPMIAGLDPGARSFGSICHRAHRCAAADGGRRRLAGGGALFSTHGAVAAAVAAARNAQFVAVYAGGRVLARNAHEDKTVHAARSC